MAKRKRRGDQPVALTMDANPNEGKGTACRAPTMPDQPTELSEYRGMWLFVMFDLPVKEAEERKEYALFRKKLLQLGFTRLQYSIYARYFSSEEASEIQRKKIKASLPPDGFVRILTVTDRQFGKMEAFIGKKLTETEVPPQQLSFF